MPNYKTNSCKIMGVINITPNSFSDGGIYNTDEALKRFIVENHIKYDILDFGAESTAPFNDAISIDEEINRFQVLVRNINDLDLGDFLLSIDTYKPEVMKYLVSELKNANLIWNDVSGVIDDDTLKLISDHNLTYILSHTNVPDKSKTNQHMEYCQEFDREGDLLVDTIEKLRSNLDKIRSNKTIVDVCFGFSKTRDQNLFLLENYGELLSAFPVNTHLIGISKKSFLRTPAGSKLTEPGILEQVKDKQIHHLSSILNKVTNRDFIFRVHDADDIANLFQA